MIINPDDEIGLLGVFDTSGTIATTINYLLIITDINTYDEDEEIKGFAPIIIFVIVICSVIGFILVIIAFIYFIRAMRGSRKTLIRMNNEI
jgi:heme/copper-type cytochrome/quinol oxidase subunit 2